MNESNLSSSLAIRPKTSPKDFFLHLGAFVALYVSAISLINLLFEIINASFPDNLSYSPDSYSYGIRLAIASLIIVYPLYLVLMTFIRKDTEKDSGKLNLSVRKWLAYITLFVAGIAVAVDLIVLINTFLGGEITIRFVLKVLVVLIVAIIVFGYYLYYLKQSTPNMTGVKVLKWAVSLIVLASIIGAFAVIGSPFSARDKRYDDRRVSDLQNIQWQVVSHWQSKGVMPEKLTDLADSISGYKVPIDPETQIEYVYKVTDKAELKFELCANFKTDSAENLRGDVKYPSMVDYGIIENNWNHKIGEICFERMIDKERYPVRPKGGY